jgi:phenylacetic acid degradation operon negative regulatory protein
LRTVTRPNSFIFTLYGDVVHRREGEPDAALWIGSLVRLMASFNISEAAVRQAVSRMSRQGWLAGEKRGARGYYRVTDRGRRRIEGLSPRIYGPVVEWDGRWRMLTYSVSETKRERRDRLRKDLTVLGWAPLSASTWISPSDQLANARESAQAAGLLGEIDTFIADNRGPRSDRELLERCWDVDAIARAYREFIKRYGPRLMRETSQQVLSDEDAFAERLWLVHDYRKFAYVDPGLPSTLLPAHWAGAEAARLFRDYYAAIRLKSERFFEGALAT